MSASPAGRPFDVDPTDRGVGRLATRQSGVVARHQLVALGLTRRAIDHRLATGRLLQIHRGVYAVGHEALSDRGRIVAGLLAAGPSAVASHRTAAALHRLIPTQPQPVEVTVHARPRRSRRGLTIHTTIRPPATATVQGIATTTPLRTLADLHLTRPAHEVERAATEALVLGLVAQAEVDRLLRVPTAPTRSRLEQAFLALVQRAGLPRPQVNHRIGPYLVDFAWPDHGVLVETDGYAAHGHRHAFERDRARDAALLAAGYVVLRFTWRQISEEPLKVAARLAGTLSPRSPARARTLA